VFRIVCGIHGIFRFDGTRVNPDMLVAMGDVTRHRGPDDAGMHLDGPCGIAMRRLSIIDLATGQQPLSNAAQTLWLVCNGEIYNYRALRLELQAKGCQFKTASDCEVLLHLYEAEGDDFVLRLNGMFSFALWDAPRRRLLLGRDRLGIKPLYVMQDAHQLAFSTEAKALLALPGKHAQLNHSAIAGYLHMGYVAAPECIFQGIRKLPAATLLSIEDKQVREWRYWQLPQSVDAGVSEHDWRDRVLAQLHASVRMQMVSDVPIGAFLSGGVDSSAVVGLMAKYSDQPINTYAIGFSGGSAESYYDELPFAKRVSSFFGTKHREIMVRPDVVSLLPKLLWHMDEPMADSAFFTTYLVSEFARQDVSVILSGVGGDELFGGYRRYLGQHYANQYLQYPDWLRRSAASVASRLPTGRNSGLLNTLRLIKSFVSTVDMAPDERYRSYLQVLGRSEVSQLLMQPDPQGWDALDAAFSGAGRQDALHRMFTVDVQTQLPDDLLALTDRMSMAVSLECRVPLLDHQLVELAATIPTSIKVRDGRLKHILKEAVADLLPADILSRKKRGFGAPMGAWLKKELSPLLARALAPEVVRKRGLFQPAAVARLIADHANSRIDGTDALLALMNLEVWSRVYLDRRDPADVSEELKAHLA
jgi:asparagine synthase (glutamine-hydrolysing)